jgi:uncharacterized protein
MKRLAVLAASFLLALHVWAQGVLPVPALTARAIDQTQTLAPDQIATLSAQLKAIEDQRGAQVVVLMVATTQPEDIFSYSNRVANTWKIGRKDVGDGVLIVVAKNDHKLRIEIAKSLEGAIPDLAASDIITTAIAPAFRQGQYQQGLQAGIAQIDARIAAATNPTANTTAATRVPPAADLFAGLDGNLSLIVIGVVLLLLSFKFLGFSNTLLILSSLTRSGSGGRYNSDGGGFGSGGGGNFDGGGASGDW